MKYSAWCPLRQFSALAVRTAAGNFPSPSPIVPTAEKRKRVRPLGRRSVIRWLSKESLTDETRERPQGDKLLASGPAAFELARSLGDVRGAQRGPCHTAPGPEYARNVPQH